MRTTITIDDRLLDSLKQRAAERDTTVSRLIEESVRVSLAPRREADEQSFELVTYGSGSGFTTENVDKISSLLELDDIERFGGGR